MWKSYKKLIILTILLTLAPILFGVIMWEPLPDKIATHFNMNNQPNGWTSKPIAVFGLPCLLVAVQVFTLIITAIDPKKKNIAPNSILVVLWLMPIMSWLVSFISYADALGYQVNINAIVITFIGILFVVLGNFSPKNQHNYSYGVRTRWALDDDENWYHTNRVAAICMVIGGILTTICGLLMFIINLSLPLIIIEIVIILVMALYPIYYSYRFYRKKQLNKQ
ncbi:SdpI family protein [Vagococcus zengguangii]|nr:SdpI family protein [Vagococcus zengguangii]